MAQDSHATGGVAALRKSRAHYACEMRSAIRLIDAAGNRAVEAARVLEDLARFCADEATLTQQYKQLRHDLAATLAALPCGVREAHRDLAGDVGTTIEGSNEGSRPTLAAIASANGSRLTEALRTLEEGVKLVVAEVPIWQRIESLRYHAYTLNARLALRLHSSESRQWRVCVVLTQALCHHPWRDVLAGALAAGAECIQVREKEMSSAELVECTLIVVEQAHRAGASVIVNDRIDVALAAGADGVHLGLRDITVAAARRIAGSALLVGATAHTATEAHAAIEAGADSCGVGAMFATRVKPDQTPAGPQWIEEFVSRWPTLPHLAIGGITPGNAPQLRALGCRGVAVSSSVCGARDPGAQVASLREIFA